MAQRDARGRVSVLVTLPAKHLSWLTREVTARGGELALSLQVGAAVAAGRPEVCPLTEAELDAVRAVVREESWEAAAEAAIVSVHGLRARLKAARRRLGVETDGRLIALCLIAGWVPAPSGRPSTASARGAPGDGEE